MSKTITLAHGNGGAENNELITKVFYKAFKNDILSKSEDAAVIQNGTLAFSTDSFTVSPLFFNGAVNYFAEMPRVDNKQELDKMYKLTDHYRKKIRVNLFNYFLKTKKRNGSISSNRRP